MVGSYGVGTFGHGGGLALLWSREVEVKLEAYDKLHIDVTTKLVSARDSEWRFTGFYGEARRELRHRSWELLKFLNSKNDHLWLCADDLNEVLHASEQISRQGRSERQMEGFREAVEECGFVDLGFIGLPYTWDNRQPANTNVKCRLDRGLANAGFLDIFQSVKVWHVQTTESDHCYLVLECSQQMGRRRRRKPAFRYENMWCRDPTYRHMVEATWDGLGMPRDLRELTTHLGTMSGALQG